MWLNASKGAQLMRVGEGSAGAHDTPYLRHFLISPIILARESDESVGHKSFRVLVTPFSGPL